MRYAASLILAMVFLSGPVLAQKEFGFDNRKGSGQPYLKPEETVAKMKVADGFEVKLFAAEPQLVNPIAMTVDEKGRVWVVECFEYPKRTPKGKMPRDRIKILEDTDGDGVCDKVTTFIEGKDFPVPFDLASGIEVGHGGVFVGAPPYLFFIENKNDKPGKIDILLKGFGSQDTHETLNTFQWGPDGRLYGLHGVFTHSEVSPGQADGPTTRMNAAVWRYDVKTKKFEIFSEGTSNPWGLDWRNSDGQFILCCCVIPHLYHMVPGGNYKRQGGQSFNPYVYGEIKEICDHTFHKESGWAHAGLISLDTPIMPEKFRNSVIFGSIHGCSIKQNILKPNGSTFTASRGEDFLVSGDKNFRPINLRWGHNGEIYCIDWHDQNPCHQTKPDDWDYERGRVYRIQPKGLKTKKAEDMASFGPQELIVRLDRANPYEARTALRLLHHKTFAKSFGPIRFLNVKNAVYSDWGFEAATGAPNFGGSYEIRRVEWWARKISDGGSERDLMDFWNDKEWSKPHKSPSLSVVLRREYASACVRHADRYEVGPLVHDLLTFKDDASDPVIPQLLWIAFEKHVGKSLGGGLKKELNWLAENAAGNALIANTIIPRTMRRLVATGKPEDLAACVDFLSGLKDAAARRGALDGLVIALKDRQVDAPANWKAVRAELAMIDDKDLQAQVGRLSINFRDIEALRRSMVVAADTSKTSMERAEAIRDLALAHPSEALPVVMKLVRGETVADLRIEAIRALAGFDKPEVAKDLLADWAKLTPPLKNEVVNVLSGRKQWAAELLNAVGAKTVQRTELTDNTILRIQAFKDKALDSQVEKVWGRARPTPAELNALIDKMRGELGNGRASFARGKLVFDNQCAKCHKFDGRGFEVGPNIEGAGRDVEYLLTNILDPNRVIGAPYFMRTLNLANGSVVTGVLAAEDEQTMTIKMENAVLRVIPKKEIEEQRVQEKSLMPEGLANNMSVQDFRDLVRYVMANPPLMDVQVTLRDKDGVRTSSPIVPPSGTIRLPETANEVDASITTEVIAPADLKVTLQLGLARDYVVTFANSNEVIAKGKTPSAKAPGGPVEIAVPLTKGTNRLVIAFRYSGKGETAFARFIDPDRKLSYPDWLQEKK